MLREIFKFMASLKLAMLLLAVIIVATAFGTYYESAYNADVARRMVYNHWWFDLWLSLLCLNLFSVAAIRYPWKPHQTGFVITHGGIIILLIGGLIDRNFGIEGSIALHRGQPATNVMELRDQEIVVKAADNPVAGRTPLKVNALISDADCRFPLQPPDPAVKAEVLDILPMMPATEGVPDADGKPMVQIALQSPVMGYIENWIELGENRPLMQMASIAFQRGMPPSAEAGATGKDGGETHAAKKPSVPGQMAPRLERHTIFALHEPTAVTKAGEPTHAKATLKVDEKGAHPQLSLELLGKSFSFKVDDIIEKEVELEGLPPWRIFVYNYYPNFRLDENGKPVSLDRNPENPAVVFDLLGPLAPVVEEPVEASPHGGGESPHGGPMADMAGINGMGGGGSPFSFTLYLGDDNKLRYRVTSRKNGVESGEVHIDQPITLKGWGPTDAKATPLQFLPRAKLVRRWKPQPAAKTQGANRVSLLKDRRAGALVQLTVNGDFKKVWVPMTQPARIYEGMKTQNIQDWDGSPLDTATLATPVEVGGRKFELSFANRTMVLPFSVQLERFHAPTNEGMDSSMSFMEFESVLSFNGARDLVRVTPNSNFAGGRHSAPEDPLLLTGAVVEEDAAKVTMTFDDRSEISIPRSDVVSLEKDTQKIHMNYPTTFPRDWYGPWLGTTYKFSQADHRMPADPDYSGVQVLRDPGWFFKWFGCLMICFGIFTMFYLKPYMSGRRAWHVQQARAAKLAAAAPSAAGDATSVPVQSAGGTQTIQAAEEAARA